jgi:hypothetical protein
MEAKCGCRGKFIPSIQQRYLFFSFRLCPIFAQPVEKLGSFYKSGNELPSDAIYRPIPWTIASQNELPVAAWNFQQAVLMTYTSKSTIEFAIEN